MIELRDVRKRFGEKQVLDGITLRIDTPGTVALTGASGCGKTTLARLLLGLDTADSGLIEGVPDKKACVFQEDRLIPHLTAEQNIRLVRPKLKANMLRDAFDAVGLRGEEQTPAAELSGGMRRRVSILRALLSEAEFIVMDEPMKGVDEKTIRRCADYVRRMVRGRTTLYITHAPEEAVLCGANRLLRLREGRIADA